MFHWQKLGRVFDPQESANKKWLAEFAQAPSAIVFDDFIRIYFSCRPEPDCAGQYVSYSAWLDLDRANPTTVIRVAEHPVLSLGARGTFDEFGTYPFSAIRHGDEIRGYYGGWTRCESVPFNVAIGMAVSKDGGKTFSRIAPGPVLGASIDEPFVISGPKIRYFNRLWYLFYIAGTKWKMVDRRPEPVYKIRVATSEDGIHWTKLNNNLIESRVEDDEAQASPDVFYRNGRFHMFFCYRYSVGYRGHERGYRIGYASSVDLVEWVRDDQKAGIDVSASGWDSEMISYPHVFEAGDEVYMAYLGNHVGKHGFGLARLTGSL